MAICSIDMISPPSMPSTVQPRIAFERASTITLIRPRDSSVSSARATPLIGSFATRMSSPRLRASVSVIPTCASWGSMYIVFGTRRSPTFVSTPESQRSRSRR